MNWIEKWLALFMMGTTISTTMQSLGGDRITRTDCRCGNRRLSRKRYKIGSWLL